MQTWLSVSASDLRYNAKTAIEYVNVPVIAVVKCNGYGMTTEYAARAWYDCGVRFFAVAEPNEAEELRELGYDDVEILLMSPVADVETLNSMLDCNVILTVTSAEKARFYVENSNGKKIRSHVKVDTGMGRFGVRYDEFESLKAIYDVDGIDYCGIFSHFALSFEPTYNKTKIQFEKFQKALKYLADNNINVGTRHIANSCAAIRFPETRLDAVRLGSALIGRLMRPTDLPLKRVGEFKARVIDIRTLKTGDTTGYAMIAKAKKDTRCAVVAAGFRHGFGMELTDDRMRFADLLRNIRRCLRKFKKPEIMYWNGKPLKVVGRIGNQSALVDISNYDVKSGDILTANVNVLMIDDIVKRELTK